MGSDGESDQASGTSSDEVQSPVRVRMRNNHHRRISNEVHEAQRHTKSFTPERLLLGMGSEERTPGHIIHLRFDTRGCRKTFSPLLSITLCTRTLIVSDCRAIWIAWTY
ncbi:hypothetical protein ILYODFUR_022173 [Ilyodon furcidens]|uniref:Uncharacterized protein n=1 Tax=Ilyodon furcidens TaxID=33524 RepID=A0ABV0UM69_9TELE